MWKIFRHILDEDFTLTKRMVGVVLFVVGVLLTVGMLAMELVIASDGFGTVQVIATGLGIASALLGLTLLPLGDQPA